MTLFAQAPSWWTNRHIIATNRAPNDFAAVNQGQVKWLATQAAAEFDDKLQALGGAGTGITALVNSFSHSNNYRVVNQGQLKNTVKPFYDRLWELGLTNCYPPHAGTPYPWSNNTNAPRHYALANIGQAKYAFSFDLSSVNITTNTDSDADGLPDWWELLASGSRTGADPNADFLSLGLSNLQLFQLGLSPTQTISAVTLTEADISFEVKAVESYRSKTIAFQDYASQTDAALPRVYFLTQMEVEQLADSQSYGDDDDDEYAYDTSWSHLYFQQLNLDSGSFSGLWSFFWRFNYAGQPFTANGFHLHESASGLASWTSNQVCAGSTLYSFDSDYPTMTDTGMCYHTSYTTADLWNEPHQAVSLPHPDYCSSNGGPPLIFRASLGVNQERPLEYTEIQRDPCTLVKSINLSRALTHDNPAPTNGTQTFTLAQEFTTPLLEQTVTGDLNRDNPFGALAWGGKWSYNYYGQRTDTASSGPTACRQLLTGELELLERKSLYRVVVKTNQYQLQTGTYYHVNVAHIFSPISTNDMDGTTNSVLETHTWVAQYTGGSQLVFNAAGTLLDVPPSNGTVSVSALKVQILQPSGSADSIRNNWTNSWVASSLCMPSYYWDFQGVSRASAAAYPLVINGSITPDTYSYNWSANTANEIGTVFGIDGCPTHQPPATASTDGSFGTIKLEALLGSVPTGISDSKQVVIYKDHLARDFTNFGCSQSCQTGTWFTPFGNIAICNDGGAWNCHGSALHAAKGSGNGWQAQPSFLSEDEWTIVLVDGSPRIPYRADRSDHFSPAAHTAIDDMHPGDIVTFHDEKKCDVGHTATSIGGARTWGANNAPMTRLVGRDAQGEITIGWLESWMWAACDLYQSADDFHEHWPSVGWEMNYIMIHRRRQ